MTTNDITYSRIPPDAAERWVITRAVVNGDQAVKKARVLPFLNPQDQSDANKARNLAYVERAVFYNATGRTLDGLLGIAFMKDPALTLPEYLAYLRTNADGAKNSIYQQSQGVVANVLQSGRHGLLVDFDARLNLPVIKSYAAESIINWRYTDNELVLVVLVESVDVEMPDGYGIETVLQYRELFLRDGQCVCRVWRADNRGVVTQALTWDVNGVPVEEIIMRTQSKPSLDFIPFRFVGSQNNDATIDHVPLYALAKLNVAHFRNSADYEDSVFYVGQAQPWISGLNEEWVTFLESRKSTMYVGSRAPFVLPQGGAFGFAQPAPNTLVKEAMDQKEIQMVALGARLLDQNALQVTATQNENDKEVSTSVLSTCVANVNEAYQTAIAWCALMLDKALSEKDAQATFKINQDYSRTMVDAPALTALVAAWQTGVIAKFDVRAYLRGKGIIATERTDEAIDDDLAMQPPALGTMGMKATPGA